MFTDRAEDRDRGRHAFTALGVGGALGTIAYGFFYDKAHGLSVPLFFFLLTSTVLFSARLTRMAFQWRNLWPLIPMMIFAGMIAIRAASFEQFLNLTAALALGGLALHYFPRRRRITQDSLSDHTNAVLTTFILLPFTPLFEFADAGRLLIGRRAQARLPVDAVVRGLLIAVPLVAIFAALFAAADAVFASYVDEVWGWIDLRTIDETVLRAMFWGGFAWLSCGAIAYGVLRRGALDRFVPGQPLEDDERPKGKRPRLSIIESSIILGSVNLLFAFFVVVQFAYFFGGRVNLEWLTYAEYARRGFFELVAAALITIGLVFALDQTTARVNDREKHLFRWLAVGLLALTGVLLVSAARRMELYEQAYGFTHLRVYTHVFMFTLGGGLIVTGLGLFRVHRRAVSLGVLALMIGSLGAVNALNVDAYIATRNIDRYYAGEPLDMRYLASLSLDSVPALAALFESADEGSTLRADAGQALARHLMELERDLNRYGGTILSAHWGRDQAYAVLTRLRGKLPEWDRGHQFMQHRLGQMSATPNLTGRSD